jgi:hypothetical protein
MRKPRHMQIIALLLRPLLAPPSTINFEGWSCWLRDIEMTTDPTLYIAVHIH